MRTARKRQQQGETMKKKKPKADSPITVTTLRTNDHADSIDLIFEAEDGKNRAVTLPRSKIPPLIALLQSKIVTGSVTPISRGSLFVGQTFALQGYRPIRQRLCLACGLERRVGSAKHAECP